MKKQKTKPTNPTKKPRLTKRMKDFLEIFEKQGCRITISCEKAKIHRSTYYDWLSKNPKFVSAVETMIEKFKDFVEGEIIKHLQKGDSNMLKFYAKTKLKDRGYVERQEILTDVRVRKQATPEEVDMFNEFYGKDGKKPDKKTGNKRQKC